MEIQTLEYVVENLESYEDEDVVYLKKNNDIDKDSKAIIVSQEDETQISEAVDKGYSYFLEIFLMIEIVYVWQQWRNESKPTIDQKIEAIYYYVENDAYLPI